MHSSGEAGREGADAFGPARRPAHRARGGIRQPAPALHRLGQAQRGAAHGRRQARPARERVRDRRRRERRLDRLRDRGGGLRAARHAVDPARAAREPRRARGGARGQAARADRARGHPRRPAHAHHRSPTVTPPIEEMAVAARERGYEYVAITDHSATHGFGNDVQADELLRQVERIRGASSSTGSRCSPAPRPTSCPTARSTTRTSARAARLGHREPAHLLPARGEEADRPHGARDGPPARRRDRPPHRPADRAARGIRDRHRPRDRRGGRDRHVPGDQRKPGPPRPQRRLREGGGRGGSDARDRLRRPLAAHAREHALRGRHGAAGVAHQGRRWPTRAPGPRWTSCASARG